MPKTFVAMPLFWVVLGGLLLFSTVPSGAQEEGYEGQGGAEREKIASMALATLAPYRTALPALSPSEEQWVTGELAAFTADPNGASGRMDNLRKSREYALWIAHKWLDPAYTALGFLLAPRQPNKKRQVILWAIVA